MHYPCANGYNNCVHNPSNYNLSDGTRTHVTMLSVSYASERQTRKHTSFYLMGIEPTFPYSRASYHQLDDRQNIQIKIQSFRCREQLLCHLYPLASISIQKGVGKGTRTHTLSLARHFKCRMSTVPSHRQYIILRQNLVE